MSVEDYCPEIDNDYDELEDGKTIEEHIDNLSKDDMIDLQNDLLSKLADDGGLKVENIIEIQYMMELIKYVPKNYKDKQEPIAKCLELIINLANKYLELYSKSVIKNKKKSTDKDGK